MINTQRLKVYISRMIQLGNISELVYAFEKTVCRLLNSCLKFLYLPGYAFK